MGYPHSGEFKWWCYDVFRVMLYVVVFLLGGIFGATTCNASLGVDNDTIQQFVTACACTCSCSACEEGFPAEACEGGIMSCVMITNHMG